MRKII